MQNEKLAFYVSKNGFNIEFNHNIEVLNFTLKRRHVKSVLTSLNLLC